MIQFNRFKFPFDYIITLVGAYPVYKKNITIKRRKQYQYDIFWKT